MFQRGPRGFGHAATLLGVAVFGASIMLISQMYHMDGNPPDAVLVWAIGALVTGVLLRSNPALALAMVLMSLWGWMETAQREGVFWPFLLGWGAVAAAFYWRKWRPGIHIAGIPLAGFVIAIGYVLSRGHDHEVVTLIGLGLVGLAVPASRRVLTGAAVVGHTRLRHRDCLRRIDRPFSWSTKGLAGSLF